MLHWIWSIKCSQNSVQEPVIDTPPSGIKSINLFQTNDSVVINFSSSSSFPYLCNLLQIIEDVFNNALVVL